MPGDGLCGGSVGGAGWDLPRRLPWLELRRRPLWAAELLGGACLCCLRQRRQPLELGPLCRPCLKPGEAPRLEMPAGIPPLLSFILSVPVLVLEFFLQFQGTLEASVNHPFCFPSVSSRLASFWSGSCYLPPPAHSLVPLRRLPWHLSALTHSTAALLILLVACVCLPRWREHSRQQGSSLGLQREPAP